MSKVVIKVEQVGKQYRLGTVGTGTLSHDFNRWWHKIRGKEDPYLKIGEANDRSKKGNSDWVWALKDISFEVRQGEVLGIIGKNGAGKSTLLKILSQVTTPSVGQIKVKGRIASLLEVGTGFHPELTGRENIFLNGAILGMSKQEIKNKFDEIVDFSGVERYIDTPVKRYSSGMYVRLAFAVAAHLEPEILIVDEVLAVGDAEFQKKCLGKMKDVSGQGRTVLFVSHNMEAVANLCNRVVTLNSGELKFDGDVDKGILDYLFLANSNNSSIDLTKIDGLERTGTQHNGYLSKFEIANNEGVPNNQFFQGDMVKFRLRAILKKAVNYPEFGVAISNIKGQRLHHLVSTWSFQPESIDYLNQIEAVVTAGPLKLYPGEYKLSIWFKEANEQVTADFIDNISSIIINRNPAQVNQRIDSYARNGGVFIEQAWDIK